MLRMKAEENKRLLFYCSIYPIILLYKIWFSRKREDREQRVAAAKELQKQQEEEAKRKMEEKHHAAAALKELEAKKLKYVWMWLTSNF